MEAATADMLIEICHEPVPTGLLDSNGVPLYRVRDTIPSGFCVPNRKQT